MDDDGGQEIRAQADQLGLLAGVIQNFSSSLDIDDTLQNAVSQISDPAELLARVNGEVCESATRGMFVTVVTGVFDPRAGTVCFANAGHQPPLHRRRDGRFEEIRPSAPPLGVTLGTSYETIEISMQGGVCTW